MHAVITGDIISSVHQPDHGWLQHLKSVLSAYGESPNAWDIYRGDSFQLKVNLPREALKVSLLIKAEMISLSGVNIRMGMGIGHIDSYADSLTEAQGSAFVHSGDAFDALKRHTLRVRSPWHKFDRMMNPILDLTMFVADNWTRASAEAFFYMLKDPDMTQSVVADNLHITQGRVSERLQRAGYDEILEIDHLYRDLLTQYCA